MTDFNPNSPDSQFSAILTRLDEQDKTLGEILSQAKKTNGRVTSLETFRGAVMVLGGIGMSLLGSLATAVALHYIH